MEATERLALDNQLWRGWKIQFISPLFLVKQPLEQEMTVDVLIFKRWAPRSLRLDGRICSNVTDLPAHLSSLLATAAQVSFNIKISCLCNKFILNWKHENLRYLTELLLWFYSSLRDINKIIWLKLWTCISQVPGNTLLRDAINTNCLVIAIRMSHPRCFTQDSEEICKVGKCITQLYHPLMGALLHSRLA